MSLFRSAMERGFDQLKELAGDSVQITRDGETIAVLAIIENPTRAIEGEVVEIDTERQPFVIQCADYKFDGVPTEPSRADRIVWEGEVWQPWGDGPTPHVERCDGYGKAWRVFTIRDEASDC